MTATGTVADSKMKFPDIQKEYDIIVAGGGITGAGVFHAAVEKGYRVLLLDAEDFAWGTSSRSSKMVHGGLRYLAQGRFLMTKAAVKEREQLLKQYAGLVTPLKFILPLFDDYGPSRASMKIGLSIYSIMAGKKQHKTYTKAQVIQKFPAVRKANLLSAVGFSDAQVDDARLVLRLIFDACLMGGKALNYTQVEGFDRDQKGCLAEVKVLDKESGKSIEIKTRVLINATGAVAETLHPSPVKDFHIRPLRGSHLMFPGHLFALDRVISFIHPQDLRPVFLFPWEGTLVLGTTDVDHDQEMTAEPFVTLKEAAYLMEGLTHVLPEINLSLKDCISSIAGVRPVLSRKKMAASKESREHVVWEDKGLITVTGGKLTTFRLLARDALKAAQPYLKKKQPLPDITPLADGQGKGRDAKDCQRVSKQSWKRLLGRYGHFAYPMIRQPDPLLFTPIENTTSIWAEIGHAAEHERVCHLSDLLLRRVRIGLFLPEGGVGLLDKIETLCSPYLLWDKKRWETEKNEYASLWKTCYSPPHSP